MYVQTLPFARFAVQNSPIREQPKPWRSGFVFVDSYKWVSESRIRFRKTCYNFAAVRCGGSGTVEEEGKFDDGYYMRRCVELARKAVGCTSPNPMVGCIIVKDGRIVGEGFHPKAGQPHAEVFAVRDAGELAENGTAYVSLEPCNHYGRTPPCTEALINAKVRSVVMGMVDPNPIVASTGVKKLQDAGIKVTVGVEEEMCRRLNEAYIHRMLTGNPFVTLRYSMSLDGHILNHVGEEAAGCGGYYSKLLQEYDAVILSSTALAEKSLHPISNEPGANQPLKLVVSKSPNSPTQIPADITSKLTILSENDMALDPQTVQEGIQMLSLDRITLPDILEHCKSQGVCSVLLDLAGSNSDFEDILADAFERNLIQKVLVEVLPLFGSSQDRALKHVNLKQKALSIGIAPLRVDRDGLEGRLNPQADDGGVA